MENTVPTWLFEMALEALAGIADVADSAEQRADASEELAIRAGITGGSLMVAGIRARAAYDVLSRRVEI